MNTEKIYQVDINKLARWLTPNRLKQPRLLNWTRSLLYPFGLLYNQFVQYRKAKLYQLFITPQKCYLQRLLNNRYDYRYRRIYILDGADKPPYFIYRADELKRKYIYKKGESIRTNIIYSNDESSKMVDDFVVFVPIVLSLNFAEVRSLINMYKLAGTKFKITTIGR